MQMMFREWQDARAYAFTEKLDGAQWAWEFLRRNPRYRSEWQAFDRVWQALEADYGRPPDRDFCAWKLDVRAWVHASECPEGDCRVDQDKVLIECALGARWGFYKFPPDPADDDPVAGGRLLWREADEPLPLIGADDTGWLGGDPARVALGFDLPLREQFEHARRQLQMLQRQRRRSGRLDTLADASYRQRLATMLRLLDADGAEADDAALAAIDGDWRQQLQQARVLCERGYRRLARMLR